MDNKEIKISYNITLIVFFCINLLVTLLFDPKIDEKVPWDKFYNSFPILSILISFGVGILLLLWGAKLFEIFWNRLIYDIFKIRNITFQEALAISILIFMFAI